MINHRTQVTQRNKKQKKEREISSDEEEYKENRPIPTAFIKEILCHLKNT